MRAEEKQVADADLARETRTEEARDEDEEKLPHLELADDVAAAQRDVMVGAIRALFDGKRVEIADLQLPDRELIALDYFRAALTGKDRRYHKFSFADDRRDMLEQALAVIEPVFGENLDDLRDIVDHVAGLRSHLTNLEDAQDEMLIDENVLAKSTVDTGDKPIPLDGPPLPERVTPPTTLTGPAVPDLVSAPTTLVGPAIADRGPAPTTLTGPPLPERAPAPTTLVGPDAPVEPKGTTTLVDPAEPPKLPWWRKPFG